MYTPTSSEVMRDVALFTSRLQERTTTSNSSSNGSRPPNQRSVAASATAAATAAPPPPTTASRQQPPRLTPAAGVAAPSRGGTGRSALGIVQERDHTSALGYASSHGYYMPDFGGGGGEGADTATTNATATHESEQLVAPQQPPSQSQPLLHTTATPSSASVTEDRSLASSQLHASGTRPDRRRRYSQALQTPLADTGLTAWHSVAAVDSHTGSDESPGSRSPGSPLGAAGLGLPASRRSSGAAPTARLESSSRRSESHSASAFASRPLSLVAASRPPGGGRLAPLAQLRTGECTSPPPQQPPRSTTSTALDFTTTEVTFSSAAAAASAPAYTSGAQSARSGVVKHSSFAREPMMREKASSWAGPGQGDEGGGRSSPLPAARRRVPLKPDAAEEPQPVVGTPHAQTARRGPSAQPSQPLPAPPSPGPARHRASTGSAGPPQPASSVLIASPPGSAAPSPAARHVTTSRSGSEAFSMHALVSRSKNADNFDYGLRALGFPVEDCRRASKTSGTGRRSDAGGNGGAVGGGTTTGATGGGGVGSSGNNSFLMAASNTSGATGQGLTSPRGARASACRSSAANAADGSAVTGTAGSSLPPLTRRQSELPSTSSGVRGDSQLMLSPQATAPLRRDAGGSGGHATRSSSLERGAAYTHVGGDDAKSTPETAATTAAVRGDGPAQGSAEEWRPPPLATTQSASLLSAHLTAPSTTSTTGSPTLVAAARRPPATSATGATTAAPLFSMTGSCGGSTGALASASWRSIVLQPRRLPYNLNVIYGDLAYSSSNHVFTGSACSSASSAAAALARGATGLSSVVKSSLATEQGAAGSRADGDASSSAAAASARRATRPPHLYKTSSGSDEDASSHSLSDDDDGDFPFGAAEADLSSVRRATRPPHRRQRRFLGDEDGDSVTLEGSMQDVAMSVKRRLGGGNRGDDAAAAARLSGSDHGTARGEDEADGAAGLRRPSHHRPNTFLPFEDGIASGSRGFSSLVLSSFLRHAGSSASSGSVATAAGPKAVGWSPSPSSSSVSVAQPRAGRWSTAGSSSTPSASGATAVMGSESGRASHFSQHSVLRSGADGTLLGGPLAVADVVTTASSDRGSGAHLGSGSSRPTARGAAPLVATAPLVPRPPSVAWAGGQTASPPPPRPGSGAGGALDRSSAYDGAPEAPAELVRAGVLRWAKPRSHAHHAPSGSEASPTAEGEEVRGVTVLERNLSPSTARVFAVDGGYTVRVVQGDLVGDCETDEHVERCTTSAAALAAAATPAPPLPSLLVDEAVTRFVEEGENAIAVVMDTAQHFLRQRSAARARDTPPHTSTAAPASTRASQPPAPPSPAVAEDSAAACPCAGVAEAMCMRVVERFLRYKAAQAAAHDDFVADLKVAVALVPVYPAELSTASVQAAVSPSDERGVFYDAVQTASTDVAGSRLPLELATSPVFGTCLNGCQWLLVEDASDITAVFELVQRLAAAVPPHTHSFLYIQFLHQCFVPEGSSPLSPSPSVAAPYVAGAAGGAQAPTRRRLGAASPARTSAARRGDIVVSSFTLASSRYPSVFEAMLDQRADTPWPLLRYALGKGPCAVLAIADVHEDDAEAAYPLSILQRMKSVQHPPPHRGSMRAYIDEQCSKIAELRWRLASTTEAAATAPEMQATTKRLTVLISKLECGAKDAEDFLADPESVHVPVYVDPRWPGPHAAVAVAAEASLPEVPTVGDSAVASAAGCEMPQVLAMVQHYSAAAGFAAQAGPRWTAAPVPAATGNAVSAASVKLTAQLSATSGTSVFDVREVTSLDGMGGTAEAEWRQCATWRHLRERVRGGFNATVAVVQESQDASRVWSLRTVLELVHGALKSAWGSAGGASPSSSAAASPSSSRRPSNTGSAKLATTWEVARVAVAVYHCSGDAVADLLSTPVTGSAAERTAAGDEAVSFVPVKAAVRPLAGAAAPPLNVASKPIGSLAELETLLREAVERLRAAQAAAASASASPIRGAAGDATRRCLLAPGYTVVSVELTQHTAAAAAAPAAAAVASARRLPSPLTAAAVEKLSGAEDAEDVRVSTLTVVNLAGHYALLSEAAHAAAATTGTGKSAAAPPSAACTLLARLLLRQRDLTVCAVALPAAPTTEAVNCLLRRVADYQATAMRLTPGTQPPLNSVRQLIAHLRGVLRVAELKTDGGSGATGPSLANLRDAVKRALAVLRDPRGIAFTSYAFAAADAEAMELPPTPPLLRVDGASARGSVTVEAAAWAQLNNSSNVATTGTVSTIGGGGSTSLVDLSASTTEKECGSGGRRGSGGDDGGAATGAATPRQRPSADMHAVAAAMSAGNTLRAGAAAYYGVRYGVVGDAPLLRRDLTTSLCPPARRGRAVGFPVPPPPSAAAPPYAGPPKAGAVADRGGAAAAAPAAAVSDADDAEDDEQVTVPTVLVLNAATTGAHVRRQGTRVRIPVPTAPSSSPSTSSPKSATKPPTSSRASSAVPPSPQYLSLGADEVVNIKPTSMGLKSSLLMRSVSCVSRGRTAALLVADTESCDATSSIAWLTMRTVMGGIFQSLKMKEVEGVRHAAAMRAFLIEEGQGDAFADLLAPGLTAAQPRRTLTRLKYSPFCGPAPADATAVPVKDLQDVNVALASVVLGARLARQSAAAAAAATPATTAATTPAASDVLRGCVVLQLTFHQYVPATAGSPADVVVSSLWCVHMGCSAGWMNTANGAAAAAAAGSGASSSASSATAALLRFWLGGPCYTTSVAGFSRYLGVRTSSWCSIIDAQQRAHPVVLRRPRPGSVRGYIEYLHSCLAHCGGDVSGGDGSGVHPTLSLSSSCASMRSQSTASRGASSWTSDAVTRVTALLKEAQRMLDRGADVGRAAKSGSAGSSRSGGGSQAPMLGLLSHEEKTFAALDSAWGAR